MSQFIGFGISVLVLFFFGTAALALAMVIGPLAVIAFVGAVMFLSGSLSGGRDGDVLCAYGIAIGIPAGILHVFIEACRIAF